MVDKKAFFIILFSVLYVIMCILQGMNSSSGLMACILVAPITFYMFGKTVVANAAKPTHLLIILGIVALVFSAELYYRTIIDVQAYGYVKISHHLGDRLDIEDDFAATLYALNASLGLVGFSIFFSKYRKKWLLTFLYTALFVLSFISVTHLVSRTGVVVMVMTLVVLALYNIMDRKHSNLMPVILVGIIVAIGYFILSDTGGMIDVVFAYQDKGSVSGSDIASASSRVGRWLFALRNLFSHPLGWSDIARDYYAHNLWFDVDRIAGIIPFVLLVTVTVLSIKDVMVIIKTHDKTVVPVVLAFYVAISLCCFVEPVIEGLAIYFFLYMFYVGVVDQLSNKAQLARYLTVDF